MHSYRLIIMVTMMSSFQLTIGMAWVTKTVTELITQRNIAAAFTALEQKDYKKVIALRRQQKVPLHVKNKQDVSLLEDVIAKCDLCGLSALVDENIGNNDDQKKILSNFRKVMQYPELLIGHVALKIDALKDFQDENRDARTILARETESSQLSANRNEMFGIMLFGLASSHIAPEELLHSFIAVGADDYINRPLPDGSCSNVHEKIWLYTPFQLESFFVDEVKPSRLVKERVTSFLFPYFSSRAFEHIDYLYDRKYNQDEENANYFHAKHAEWKAMSKARTALVNNSIGPCSDIVKDYLEGDEAKQIREELVGAIQTSYNDVTKGYSKTLKPKTVESDADLIMHYTGIYGRCDN